MVPGSFHLFCKRIGLRFPKSRQLFNKQRVGRQPGCLVTFGHSGNLMACIVESEIENQIMATVALWHGHYRHYQQDRQYRNLCKSSHCTRTFLVVNLRYLFYIFIFTSVQQKSPDRKSIGAFSMKKYVLTCSVQLQRQRPQPR